MKLFILFIALSFSNLTFAQDSNFEKTHKLAEQKNARAQFTLGVMYYQGQEVPQNFEKSFDWFHKAALQGHVKAQFNLGVMYYYGQGILQYYKLAFYWYHKAAMQGHAGAQFTLGDMYYYEEGVYKEGVKENKIEASNWYKKAALQGHPKAQYQLGLMYYEGDGIPQNFVYAYAYLNLAVIYGVKNAKKERNAVEENMSSEEITEAKKLSQDFFNIIN